MKIFNWARCKTLRDLNNEALERTRTDLAYARLVLGRAKMEVELLEAREKCLVKHADELTSSADVIEFPTITVGMTA